jgi:1-acyl-sn-glycerol-3-phosphate acyltransferase
LSGRRGHIALWRALRLSEHLITGALLAVPVALLGQLRLPRPWLPALVAWWHRRLTRCLGVTVTTLGTPAPGALLVANHVSWLDIPAAGGLAPVRFVSKSEVRQWPLLGWLAAMSGTLFLRRGAHQATALAASIAAQLQGGATIMIFPEGTTGDGRQLGRFHARLFAAAEGGQAPLQPVAIRYGAGPEPDRVAPFIGDDTLLAHLRRVLCHPGLYVSVCFMPPMLSHEMTRRALAEATRNAIGGHLQWLAERAAADAEAGAPTAA